MSVRVRPVRSAESERRWRDRMSALSAVWHPHLLTPIDYGPLGRARCFEAWPSSDPMRRPPDRHAACAIRSALACLAALGLTAGRPGWRRARMQDDRVALLPDAVTGLCANRCGDAEAQRAIRWRELLDRWRDPVGLRVVGVRLQERSAVRWVADVLDCAKPGDLRSIRLGCPRGAGVSTLVGRVAREARVRGYLPIDVGIAAAWRRLEALVCDRHILLIDRRQTPRLLERVVLSPAVRSARGCVVLSLDRERGGADPIDERDAPASELDAVPVARLAASAIVHSAQAIPDREVSRAARQSEGWPGRFVALLQSGIDERAAKRSGVAMVHESTAAYSASDEEPDPPSPSPPRRMSREGPALAHALWRAEQARAFAGRGRHAAAERSWRAALAAFGRRGCAELAAEAAIELAGVLAARGRTNDALAVIRGIRAASAGQVQIRLTLCLATLLVDEGRLAEAEGAARAVRMAADRARGSHEDIASALALARCLMWQGRADEASRVLPSEIDGDAPLAAAVLARRARIEIVRLNIAEAGRAASAATHIAGEGLDHRLRAAASAAMAAVLAEIGDEAGFREHARLGLSAARAARAPLAIARMHLVFADGCVRLGLSREYRAIGRMLGRWALRQLPPLLRARVQHALGRLGDAGARQACDEFVRATGAMGVTVRTGEDRAMEGLQELSDVLRICHESPDELTALARVCSALRDSLKAISVSVVVAAEGGRALAGAGGAWAERSDVSVRAIESGHVISPIVTSAGIEAAVPFRYAGRTVGALLARWSIAACDASRHGMTRLVAAAAATAPSLRAALDRLATRAPIAPGSMPALLGTSPAMQAVREATLRAARAPFAVLIEGESGSGKELVARAVHEQSDRRARRLCAVNCAALGEDLLEAELFGHARGAFTGAIAERPGLFEEADGGTLLLDEISELSPRAQAKLLRTIQEGEIRRVGESLPRKVDVRLIAASNRRLEEEVAGGRFRADLRYRLEVIRIVVPPLRARPEDIPLLAGHFWEQAVKRTGGRATLDPDTLGALARYDWPGNVRELRNAIERALVLSPAGTLRADELLMTAAPAFPKAGTLPFPASLDEIVRAAVLEMLRRTGGNKSEAARRLGISRPRLQRILNGDLDDSPTTEET